MYGPFLDIGGQMSTKRWSRSGLDRFVLMFLVFSRECMHVSDELVHLTCGLHLPPHPTPLKVLNIHCRPSGKTAPAPIPGSGAEWRKDSRGLLFLEMLVEV